MSTVPHRDDIPRKDQWDLGSLYRSEEEWEKDLQILSSLEEQVHTYPGTLSESADTLLAWLHLQTRIEELDERLGYYAMLRHSEDAGKSENQDRLSRYTQITSRLGAATSFFAPEIQQIPDATMEELLADPRLDEYRISLNRVLRYKPHTLAPGEERILAMQQEANQTASRSFSALLDVDLDFGEVDTPEGPRTLTQSSFGSLLEHRDRAVRERAFRQFYRSFDQHKNTLAALYAGSVNLDIYRARVRNFSSALESRLFPDDVPSRVYENLLSVVRQNLPLLHRYYRLRTRALRLEDPAVWDTRVALVPDITVHNPYEEAVETVLASLAPLGEDYVTTLRGGLLGGWVDRYENKGKRSGAFSAGSYRGDPYILLNYKEDTLRDMFTLTHEAGHSMHSWYSVRNNPFQHYQYTIFEAEVASTFNEQLLVHHLLGQDQFTGQKQDRPMRAYLISKHVDDIVATLFRQTMFAEYEKLVHEQVESGKALTVDWFRQAYRELLQAYYGDTLTIPDLLDLEGLRIPHFYRAFYVYKYATGISAAITLSRKVLEGGPGEREAYFRFLRSGGSRFPLESLAVAGVDMTRPEPVQLAMDHFSRQLDLLEEALFGEPHGEQK
ncbi:oligoendopeptidase F [Alkalispirochaeta alkalica]|uniref:oligoendopeptidase F n=1 Tax=Alkalispirochaeta alkalica TaxID=46356 RepID=UPI000362D6C6|nr:oligoendopeptidase F [Alkalispirochaeta alkalica]